MNKVWSVLTLNFDMPTKTAKWGNVTLLIHLMLHDSRQKIKHLILNDLLYKLKFDVFAHRELYTRIIGYEGEHFSFTISFMTSWMKLLVIRVLVLHFYGYPVYPFLSSVENINPT